MPTRDQKIEALKILAEATEGRAFFHPSDQAFGLRLTGLPSDRLVEYLTSDNKEKSTPSVENDKDSNKP